MIEVQQLTKAYRDLVAVDKATFTVQKGEIVGFLGLNGAGKSTTMKILTGYVPASSGVAKVAGFDVFEQPMEVKRRIGYLPEVLPLYPDLTVWENLDFVAAIKGVKGGVRKAEIDRVIQKADLGEVRDRLVMNLSKGFQQRVGIAQSLLGNPPVLILDEPTSGLDPRQRENALRFIQELASEHTIILSTHILSEVEAICPRAIVIHRGRIVADDKVDAIRSQYKTATFADAFNRIIDDVERIKEPVAAKTAVKVA